MSRWTADELYEYVKTLEFGGSPAPSGDGDKYFEFTQDTPSDTWTIDHGLGKNPSVTVVDSADNVVEGDCNYINENKLILSFSSAFSGKAYLN